MKSKVADLSLALTAIIWGSGFIASQYAIDSNMSTSLILLLRFSISSIVLFTLFFKKIITINKQEFKYGAITGTILFLAFYTQTLGLKFTTPSNNAFITATYVIMVPFITLILFKKKLKKKFLFLPFFTFLGVAILSYSTDKGLIFSKGDIITLLCAFLFALHISYLDVVSKKVDVIKIAFLQFFISSVLSLIVFGVFEGFKVGDINFIKGSVSILYLGLFSTCLCFSIQTFAQKYTTSSKVAIILSTESLFASLFSVLLEIEPFSKNLLIGGALILITVIISETDLRFIYKKNSLTTKESSL